MSEKIEEHELRELCRLITTLLLFRVVHVPRSISVDANRANAVFKDIAERVEIGLSELQAIRKAEVLPTVSTLEAIFTAIGVSLADARKLNQAFNEESGEILNTPNFTQALRKAGSGKVMAMLRELGLIPKD